MEYDSKNKSVEFALLVMSASKKLNNKQVKKILNCKNMKFANLESVWKITVNYIYFKKCFNGAVPPFGSIFGLKTFMDQSLKDQGDSINFNSGKRTNSVCMSLKDYLFVENPVICNFCE